MNVFDALERQAERAPDRAFLLDGDEARTFGELFGRVEAASACLYEAGLREGAVAVLRFEDQARLLEALLAVARLGATAFVLPPRLPSESEIQAIRRIGATFLACDAARSDPRLSGLVRADLDRGVVERALAERGPPPPRCAAPTAPWLIAMGSGSAGAPKLLPFGHDLQLGRMRHDATWLPLGPEDALRSWVSFDFYAAQCRFLNCIHSGCRVIVRSDRTAPEFDQAGDRAATVIFGTAFHAERLIRSLPDDARNRLGHLKALVLGMGVVDPDVREAVRRRLTHRLHVCLDVNECSTVAVAAPETVFDVPGTVGKPIPPMQVEVVDEKDRPLPPLGAGRIRVRSPLLFDGYLDDPAATAERIRDGWFRLGDVGRFVEGGELVHLGGAHDMMVVDGIDVYPAEIEAALRAHPAVGDAVSVARRHPVHGDVPVGVVALARGATATAREVGEFARARLGPRGPHVVAMVPEIPRAEHGKLRRRELDRILDDRDAASVQTRPTTLAPTQQLRIGLEIPDRLHAGRVSAWRTFLEEALDGDFEVRIATRDASRHEVLPDYAALVVGCLFYAAHARYAPLFGTAHVAFPEGGPHAGRLQLHVHVPRLDGLPRAFFQTALNPVLKLALWCNETTRDARSEAAFFDAAAEILEPVRLPGFAYSKSGFFIAERCHHDRIPVLRLGGGLLQLGWGRNGRLMDRSLTDRDSSIGMRLAQDKFRTAALLREAGLPAPVHERAATVEAARSAAGRIGWPVVVKPLDGDRGEGVSMDVSDDAALETALERAVAASRRKEALVERQVEGLCHRLFVAHGRLLYAVKRWPLHVVGDGRRTVETLVAEAREADRRRPPWRREGLDALPGVDGLARAELARAGLEATSTPEAGRRVHLRRIETTAWGGVDEDVSETAHPQAIEAALTAARLFRLEVAGIDVICDDITRPPSETGAVISEVNTAPLLGGGDVSRARLSEFLARHVPQGGRIPVEAFVGGRAARETAARRWRERLDAGEAAFLTGGPETLSPAGASMSPGVDGLRARLRSLVLCPTVERVVAWVGTDELLAGGLPVDALDSVVAVDGEIGVHGRDGTPAGPERAERLVELLRTLETGGLRSDDETPPSGQVPVATDRRMP